VNSEKGKRGENAKRIAAEKPKKEKKKEKGEKKRKKKEERTSSLLPCRGERGKNLHIHPKRTPTKKKENLGSGSLFNAAASEKKKKKWAKAAPKREKRDRGEIFNEQLLYKTIKRHGRKKKTNPGGRPVFPVSSGVGGGGGAKKTASQERKRKKKRIFFRREKNSTESGPRKEGKRKGVIWDFLWGG